MKTYFNRGALALDIIEFVAAVALAAIAVVVFVTWFDRVGFWYFR